MALANAYLFEYQYEINADSFIAKIFCRLQYFLLDRIYRINKIITTIGNLFTVVEYIFSSYI